MPTSRTLPEAPALEAARKPTPPTTYMPRSRGTHNERIAGWTAALVLSVTVFWGPLILVIHHGAL